MKIDSSVLEKMRDPKFYLENFTKIRGKSQGALIPFILKDAQKDLFNTLRKVYRMIICKARQIGFCLDPNTKVLTSNLEWVSLDNIMVGQSIVAIDENISGGKGSARKIKTAVVENKFSIYEDAIKITFDNGKQLIATPGHRFLFKDSHRCSMQWKRVDELRIGDETGMITDTWDEVSYEDGWFGGIIDGEGHLSKPNRTGVSLTVSQVKGPVWDRILKYAINNGIGYRLEIDKRVAGESSKLGSKEVNKLVVSNMFDVIKILGKVGPSRFKTREFWVGKRLGFTHRPKITKIEHLGKQRMIDLQTSEKTYIAEGFVSHNSTALVGFFYHDTIMNPGTTTALIGYNADLTSELLEKVKTFYKTTPVELRPTIQYNSRHEISFPRMNSKILVLPSTVNVGRGYTINNCLCTELSAWEDAEEKMMTLEASVPINGRIVVESTPRGMGNLYHKMWMADNNGYTKKEYGWWWGYNQEEIDIIRRRMNNPQKFAQEYGLDFLAAGRSVFDVEVLKEQRKNVLAIGDKVKLADGTDWIIKEEDGLRIYRPPEAGKMYACGADVAEGVSGGDYSTAFYFDRQTGEEVAMYRGYIPPDLFGLKLDKWGRKYNNAFTAVEVNNHGLTTLTILKQQVYPSIYFRPVKFETISATSSDKMGWKTTKMTRELLIDDFAQATRDKELVLHSKELVDEMTVMIYDDRGTVRGQEGFNDDCVFGAAIALQAFKMLYHKPMDQLRYEEFLPINFGY